MVLTFAFLFVSSSVTGAGVGDYGIGVGACCTGIGGGGVVGGAGVGGGGVLLLPPPNIAPRHIIILL